MSNLFFYLVVLRFIVYNYFLNSFDGIVTANKKTKSIKLTQPTEIHQLSKRASITTLSVGYPICRSLLLLEVLPKVEFKPQQTA